MPKDRATHQGEKQLKILHFELSVLLLPSLEEAYRLHRHFQFSCTAETNSSAGHAGERFHAVHTFVTSHFTMCIAPDQVQHCQVICLHTGLQSIH